MYIEDRGPERESDEEVTERSRVVVLKVKSQRDQRVCTPQLTHTQTQTQTQIQTQTQTKTHTLKDNETRGFMPDI